MKNIAELAVAADGAGTRAVRGMTSFQPALLLNVVVRLSRMTLLERCCWITKRPGPGNPHVEGLRDELVISNRDLTAAELQELIKK
jgi:hypothetical protein